MYSNLGFLKAESSGSPGPGPGPDEGTFPSIASLTLTQDGNSPYNAVMPAAVAAGDLLIILTKVVSGTGGLTDVPSSWARVVAGIESIMYKWAAGTEGGTLVTMPVFGSVTLLFTVLRIQGAALAQNPEGAYLSPVNTATPNPPSVDPTWADANNLFIAWTSSTGVRNIVSYPAGYTFHQQKSDGANGTSFIAAKRSINSALEDPGVFTISSSANCAAATIAVRGA